MRRLNRVISGIYDRAFRPIGLTVNQLNILVVLARQGGTGGTGGAGGAGGVKPTEVCGQLQMDKSTLSRNIQRMQRQGWVRAVKIEDARSHRLEVTGTGLGLIEQALPMWQQAQARARVVLDVSADDGVFDPANPPTHSKAPSTGRWGPNTPDGPEPRPADTSDDDSAVDSARRHHRAPDQGIFFWE